MMKNLDDSVAETNLDFKHKDGNSYPFRFILGKPYKTENQLYTCPVQIYSYEAAPSIQEGQGTDSFEAILNGIEILNIKVQYYRQWGSFYIGKKEVTELLPKNHWQNI